MRRVLGPFTVLCALFAAGLAGPTAALAAITATITIQPEGAGSRVIAALATDKPLAAKARPTGVSVALKGRTLVLTKVAGTTKGGAPGTWRSAVLKGKQATAARALVGKKVALTVKAKAGSKTVKGLAGLPISGGTGGSGENGGNGGSGGNGGATPTPTPAPTVPTPTPAPTPVPTPTSLFGNPSTALSGQPALDAIQPYILDSTFTDCPTGWPTCAGFEDRYSAWSNGNHWYCHLTPTSGPDVYSAGTDLTFTGASQEPNGAWAVSYAIKSYGDIAYYRWDVSPQGAASGTYWIGVNPATSPPTRTMTGFKWMRGRKDCSY